MADENKPSDKVDLASTELKIGGVNLKGSYIVWFFAVVSAVGGTIYAAGGATLVWANVAEGRSVPLPDAVRAQVST